MSKRAELVEAAARAIVPLVTGSQEDSEGRSMPDFTYDDLTPDWRHRCDEFAEAAVAAVLEGLREPSEGMVSAGWSTSEANYSLHPRDVWPAMLDAVGVE